MVRCSRGQASVEYAGALALIAAIFVAVGALGLSDRISGAVADAACAITGQGCDAAGGEGSPGADPAAVDRAATDLRGLTEGGASPAEVADYFEGLDPAVAEALAAQHPELVGNTDGAPIPLRYAANAVAIDREIQRLRDEGVAEDDPRLKKLLEFDDPNRRFLVSPAGPPTRAARRCRGSSRASGSSIPGRLPT